MPGRRQARTTRAADGCCPSDSCSERVVPRAGSPREPLSACGGVCGLGRSAPDVLTDRIGLHLTRHRVEDVEGGHDPDESIVVEHQRPVDLRVPEERGQGLYRGIGAVGGSRWRSPGRRPPGGSPATTTRQPASNGVATRRSLPPSASAHWTASRRCTFSISSVARGVCRKDPGAACREVCGPPVGELPTAPRGTSPHPPLLGVPTAPVKLISDREARIPIAFGHDHADTRADPGRSRPGGLSLEPRPSLTIVPPTHRTPLSRPVCTPRSRYRT